MYNLCSITTNQAAIAALFRVMNRYVGNLPPMPGVFPDYPAWMVKALHTHILFSVSPTAGGLRSRRGSVHLASGCLDQGWVPM
jgi:hypothetical protein